MLEKGKISNMQASILLVSGVLPTALITLPAITCEAAGPDAWLSVFFASLVGMCVILVAVSLGLRFPGRTIIEYSETIAGRFLGKIIGLIFIWFFLHMSAVIVREFAEFIITVSMPETPLIVFVITILFTAAVAVRSGLEVIARTNDMFFTIITISFITLVVLATKDLDLSVLTPVLAKGLIPPLRGAVPTAGWIGETITIAFLLPYMNRPEKGARAGIAAVIIISVFLTIADIVAMATFGHAQTPRLMFPTFMVARYISIAGLIERMESLIALIWIGGVFVKISLYYYVAVLATAQWAGLADYRPITFPIGTIIGALSILLFANIPELITFLSKVWGPYSVPIELGLPLILLTAAWIRKKGGKPE